MKSSDLPPTPPSPTGPSGAESRISSRRQDARRRRRLWLGSLLGLLVVGVVVWKLVIPGLKEARAQRFAAEAEALMRRDEYNEAFAKVIAALRFAPRDPTVLRTAAKLCLDTGNPNGLRYYESLVSLGAATPEDRKHYAQLALALRRFDIAGRELIYLLKQDSTNLELLHLLAQQQQEAADLTRATRTATYALTLDPNDPKTQFLYGSLLLRNKTNSIRADGRRTLWGLALSEGPYADRAVETLMLSPELADGEIRLLIRDLQTRTNLRPTDLLRSFELQMRLEPGRSNQLIRQAFETMTQTNDSIGMLALLSQWAAQQRQAELVLEKVPAAVARTNTVLAPLRAYALAQARRWDELTPVLEDRRFPLDPVVANVLRGEMALASNNRKEAEAAFKTALEQPKIPVERILLVARSAEGAGFPLIAVSAYQRLYGTPGRSVWASLEILRALRAVDDLSLVRDALKKLNEQLPGDDAVAGERAWAELLLNNRIKESKAVAQRMLELQPQEVQWKFLMALALLREQRPSEALTIIENLSPEWNDLRPRWQAVYVAVLGANDQREAARTYAARVPLEKMRSAEEELVKPFLSAR